MQGSLKEKMKNFQQSLWKQKEHAAAEGSPDKGLLKSSHSALMVGNLGRGSPARGCARVSGEEKRVKTKQGQPAIVSCPPEVICQQLLPRKIRFSLASSQMFSGFQGYTRLLSECLNDTCTKELCTTTILLDPKGHTGTLCLSIRVLLAEINEAPWHSSIVKLK